MEPKKIYLSGKITGDDNYAETFENKAAELTEQGALVFNPAVHPNMFTHGQFMVLDLLALSFCNSIYMMKNWRDSKGAKMEFEEAKVLGLPVEFEEPLYAVSKVVDGETLYYSSVSKDFTTSSASDITSDDLFVSEKEAQSILSLSPEKLGEVHFENAEDIFCGKENSFIKLIEKESDVENIREALQKSLEENTVLLKEIELNYENWNKFFPYGFVDTPVGKIKLGENQFKKLQKLDRNNLLFALNETLKNPGIVLSKETYDEVNEEFRPVEVFGKSFIREESGNKRIVESVIIFRDGEKISIGTHNKDIKRFVKQIKTADQIVYLDEKVSRVASLFYRAGGSHVQLPRDNNIAVTISDMVERTTGKKLVTVNSTRESEYVKSLDSNIPQNESSVNKGSSSGVKLSKNVPHKTAIGYKVFYLKDGKLYPPMVQNPGGSDTPVGVWIDASAGDVAGYSKTGRPQIAKGGAGTHTSDGLLAYRPGWHLGTVPIARQFEKTNPENGVKELFPREFVWAECEYACDVDYQKEAMQEGMTENGAFRHSYAGLKHLPENGSYRYRTNPDPNTEEWIITGAIKVKRILSNKEVEEICRKNGRQPQKRERSYEELNNIFGKYFFEQKQKNPYIRFESDKETVMKTLEAKGTLNVSESKALLSWLKNEKRIASDREYSTFFEKCQQEKGAISKSAKVVKNLEDGLSR